MGINDIKCPNCESKCLNLFEITEKTFPATGVMFKPKRYKFTCKDCGQRGAIKTNINGYTIIYGTNGINTSQSKKEAENMKIYVRGYHENDKQNTETLEFPTKESALKWLNYMGGGDFTPLQVIEGYELELDEIKTWKFRGKEE